MPELFTLDDPNFRLLLLLLAALALVAYLLIAPWVATWLMKRWSK